MTKIYYNDEKYPHHDEIVHHFRQRNRNRERAAGEVYFFHHVSVLHDGALSFGHGLLEPVPEQQPCNKVNCIVFDTRTEYLGEDNDKNDDLDQWQDEVPKGPKD